MNNATADARVVRRLVLADSLGASDSRGLKGFLAFKMVHNVKI
jgi:hypothetical protein